MKTSCCHSKLAHQENNQTICMNSECENYLGSVPFTFHSRFWNKIFALFLFVFIFLFTFSDYSFTKNALIDSADALLKIKQNQPLTADNLMLELKNQEVACRKEVFAQLQIESGHLSSYLSVRANNLCGMRYPFKRSTAAVGLFLPETNTIVIGSQKELKKYSQKNNYAVYATWQDCVKDYKLWQDECFKLKEKYLAFLGANYAEDADYISKINSVKK